MTGLEKRKKGAQQEISVAPFPPYFGLFGFVFLFFLVIQKRFCFMTASKTDKKDTMGGTRGRKMLFDFKRRTFCVCLHERQHLSRPLRKQGKWNGRDYFPPFGSADIYGAGTHESHRDGQFAQMVAILGQHSNEKRGREKKME